MKSVDILNVLLQTTCVSLVTMPTPPHCWATQSGQLMDLKGHIQQSCGNSEDLIWGQLLENLGSLVAQTVKNLLVMQETQV